MRHAWKKGWIVMMVLIMVALTACAGGGNNAANTKKENTASPAASAPAAKPAEEKVDKVTLKLLYIWPEFKTTMEKTIDLFEEKNPNIDVELSVTPWDKVKAQLQTGIAGGDAPDISFMWPKDMSPFIASDAALDLTPYMEADPAWKDSFVDPAVLNGSTYDGRIYNAPFRGSTTYIAYNKDMFEENGWAEPTSLEELETLMVQMMDKNVTPFAIAGKPDGFQIEKINQYFVGYNLMESGVLEDPEYRKARKTDIEGAYAKAFVKSKEWNDKGYYGKSALGVAREQSQALFFQGTTAMIMLNNNELTAMRKGVADKFEMKFMVFPAPAGSKDLFMPGGMDGYMVYKKTEHPDEAIVLMKYLNSKEAQDLWATETLSVMTVKGVEYSDPDMATFAKYINVAGKYNQFPDYNTGDVVTKNAQAFANYLQDDSYTPEKLEQLWNDNYKQQIESSK